MVGRRLLYELLWIGIAALTALGIAAPAYLAAGPSEYLLPVAALAFAFVTILRLVFFHTESHWINNLFVKAFVCILMLPMVAYAVLTLNGVQNFVDAQGFEAVFPTTSAAVSIPWGNYIRDAVLLLAAGVTLSALVLPVVLIIRAFQQVKAGEYKF